MRIAVTAVRGDLTADVDKKFGRAAYFTIFDSETGRHNVLDNSENVKAAHGADIQAASRVLSEGVDVILTGHCGPRAFGTLTGAGIDIITGVSGTVNDAIKEHGGGGYQESTEPDVESHWQ